MEAITDPGFRQDVEGFFRFGLNLAAQLLDKDAQVFHFVAVVRTPNGLQQFTVRDGAIGVGAIK